MRGSPTFTTDRSSDTMNCTTATAASVCADRLIRTTTVSSGSTQRAGRPVAGHHRCGRDGRLGYRMRKAARSRIALTVLGVDRRMREIAAWVQDATPRLVELVLERMRVEAPAYFAAEDPGFMDMARESIVANLEAVTDGLRSGRDQPVQLPPGAVEEAVMAARQRMPWTLVDRTYRIGQAVLWEELLGAVETWELDSAERVDLLRVTSHFLFQYVDHVTSGLAEVHQAERDRQFRGRDRRRLAWVREVLAGVAGAGAEAEYDLGRRHLAVIAWGADPERAIAELGQRLRAAVLTVAGHSGSVWGWLGAIAIAPSWPSVARRLP